jgi:hypothetical protein
MIDVEGPLRYGSSEISLIGGVHIGARALLDINLIWFGYIARISPWEGGGYFTRLNDFYLPSLQIKGGGGGQHPVRAMHGIDMPGFYNIVRCTMLYEFSFNIVRYLFDLKAFFIP